MTLTTTTTGLGHGLDLAGDDSSDVELKEGKHLDT
jgi:hypothetical protein